MGSKVQSLASTMLLAACLGMVACGGDEPTAPAPAGQAQKGKAAKGKAAKGKAAKGKAKADVERVTVSVFLVDPTGTFVKPSPEAEAGSAEGENDAADGEAAEAPAADGEAEAAEAPAAEEPVAEAAEQPSGEEPPAGGEPKLVEVKRKVGAKMPEKNAVWVMYKGASPKEKEAGLTFWANGTEGFQGFAIEDGVAKLQLRGSCEDAGALTVYDSIAATLKQFDTVEFVQVAAPGQELPEGLGKADFRPDCLQP